MGGVTTGGGGGGAGRDSGTRDGATGAKVTSPLVTRWSVGGGSVRTAESSAPLSGISLFIRVRVRTTGSRLLLASAMIVFSITARRRETLANPRRELLVRGQRRRQ